MAWTSPPGPVTLSQLWSLRDTSTANFSCHNDLAQFEGNKGHTIVQSDAPIAPEGFVFYPMGDGEERVYESEKPDRAFL
ncbi:hypothetical protein LTR08_002396 [Meristemomyces frigidus]|nr:hypothetical protein LTR08_002396 [Meristemomyces frigidus]